MAFISQFKVYYEKYCTHCCAVAKEHILTIVIIFDCENKSFWINDTPLLKVVAFNVTRFDVALFDAVLFDVELF